MCAEVSTPLLGFPFPGTLLSLHRACSFGAGFTPITDERQRDCEIPGRAGRNGSRRKEPCDASGMSHRRWIMKRLFHSICMTSALLGLVAAGPHPVRAQDVAHGTFVLPFEVQWGGKTLEPGKYHFRLPSHQFGEPLFIRDAQGRGKLMVSTRAKDDFSGPSMLTIVKRNGKRYVSSLAIQYLGAKLEYQVPRQKAEASEPREASVQTIPVHVAGS